MLSGTWPGGAPNALMLVRVVMTGTWGGILCIADFCELACTDCASYMF